MKKVAVVDLMINQVLIKNIEDNQNLIAEDDDLVFKAPSLCGYGILGLNRLDIYSQNSNSKAGGYFAHYLKCNGYDYLLIKGKSKEPVYIYINNENVFIKSAEEIYFLDKESTENKIKKDLNKEDIEIAQVGIAACHGVDFSRIILGNKSCGKDGLGKLMGEKNLKAIVLNKAEFLKPKCREKLYNINRKIANKLGNEDIEAYYNEQNNCFGCIVNCGSTSIKKIMKKGFSLEEAENLDSISNHYGMDSCIFASIADKEEDFEKLAEDIVFNNKSYELKSSKKSKIHDESDEFEELGFCRFLIKKNILDHDDIKMLKECILGE
ncbi:MAG: aldehyde ferredoxin oxidoreductase N-terminal domain-containing protein [Intestinibacter sp.]|uniref:aldehyde ferredoxin oxidoreductase N-terminal domain-containing protein n=1 Tax=Intestinibacter sp. TaxID=1965304 RepID=UPI003F15B90D